MASLPASGYCAFGLVAPRFRSATHFVALDAYRYSLRCGSPVTPRRALQRSPPGVHEKLMFRSHRPKKFQEPVFFQPIKPETFGEIADIPNLLQSCGCKFICIDIDHVIGLQMGFCVTKLQSQSRGRRLWKRRFRNAGLSSICRCRGNVRTAQCIKNGESQPDNHGGNHHSSAKAGLHPGSPSPRNRIDARPRSAGITGPPPVT